MFTGIIEDTGLVKEIHASGSNLSFVIESGMAPELKLDQSVSHSGVCLTVENVNNNSYQVTAVAETLAVTNLQQWKAGTIINLERCMILNGRLDGHIVQGHVDAVATCISINRLSGSTEFTFTFDRKFAGLVIEKGSVCLNGISLTCFNITEHTFTVTIIPYTMEHTNISMLTINDTVNIEFDVIGKYILRQKELEKIV